jgi:SAM-dependent methyltransferase
MTEARFELQPRQCPICVSSPTRVLGFRGGRYHRYGAGVETRIVQCRTCSLIFPDPFPRAVKPSELYGDPVTYFADHDEQHKVENYRVHVRDMLGRMDCPDPAILDVGCGRGELLQAARMEGVTRRFGLELSDGMVDYARKSSGAQVFRETIEEFAAHTDQVFDCVVLGAVIEHVYEPDSMIACVRKLTRPGSIVYIDAPCEPHLLTRIGNQINRARGNAAVYNLSPTWPPYHVYGFNPKSLKLLLAKHGFELEELRVWAAPQIPSNGTIKDRFRSAVGSQIMRLANFLGMASNMSGWARRKR